MQHIGKTLIIVGIFLVIGGLILYFSGQKLNWIGKLPGDIRIVRENFRFYFPITTMIIFSIVLSAIVWVIRKLF